MFNKYALNVYYVKEGEGNGKPLQYSCLENPMDRGAWETTPSMGSQSWMQLSD